MILPVYTVGVPSSYGDVGVDVRARLTDASITNMGTVSGGAGGMSYGDTTYHTGGIGIDALGAGTLIDNAGLITGGAGAYVGTYDKITTRAAVAA